MEEYTELVKQLRSSLSKGIVYFSYKKINGEWREAAGTTCQEGIEYVGGTLPTGTGKTKEGTIPYYDLDAEGWRSCREDSIIDVRQTYTVEEYKQLKEE